MDPPSNNKRIHLHAHSEIYRECQKNHAAALGAHAIDGCGEFIAAPTYDPADPTSLTCAACGCHRNFHRKEEVEDGEDREEEEDEEEEEEGSHVLLTLKTGGMGPTCCSNLKRGKNKRFRSRFTREQKEGMMELAERLGWRLQRKDEALVEEGCRKIGVERGVFKVWMHNNKQAVLEMKRRNKMMMVVKSENHKGCNGDKVNGENGLNCSSPSPSPN